MTSTAATSRTASPTRLHSALLLVAAVAVAVAINAMIAAVAVASGAPASYGPLTFPAYTLFTAVGIAAGWAGWVLVHRRARDPRRMLRVLVPLVTLVSFVPDVLLLILGFIPGTTATEVIALMLMHVAVVAVAVPTYVLATRGRG